MWKKKAILDFKWRQIGHSTRNAFVIKNGYREEFCIWQNVPLCCEILIILWEMYFRQSGRLAYSYRTQPKMWRTKRSQKLCAVIAACPFPVCVSVCASVCACIYLDMHVCVPPVCVCVCILQYVQLCPYNMCMQPFVSPIVLSGSDRVSTTVCERRDGREKIAALQLCSQWWLLSGDYTAALLSTWKDMNRTTTTELNYTA